jgi:hypothetical protein
MSTYNDIYLRAYLGDPGNVPRSTEYPLNDSPDLIPYGTQPVETGTFLTDASWNTIYRPTLVMNIDNYIYMRAQNLGQQETSGEFSLYAVKDNLLSWPPTWTQLKTQQGEMKQKITLAANQKGVLPEPFVWIPDSAERYSLVGLVSTPNHPLILPPDQIQDFARWVARNGGVGWHSVNITNVNAPTFTNKMHYEQGTTACMIAFNLVCTNVPLGSKVSFSCGLSGPSPLIDLAPTVVTDSKTFIVGIVSDVPAGFEGDISYSYWSNGGPPPPGFNITLQARVYENE